MAAREVLSAYGNKIGYAFLFGSALTHLRADSDVDILVGGDLTFDQKMDLTAKLVLMLRRKVDLVQASETRCELVLKALSKGMPILIRDPEALKRDYFKKFRLYDDTTNLRRLKLERIKRQYAHG